jgi:hypothetical protein
MKALVLMPLLFLAVMLQSCTEDENPQQSEKVEFQFTFSATTSDGGRTNAGELPDGADLILTLVDKTGAPVLTNHRVEILSFGGNYVTGPIELKPVQYSIMDFMIADGSDILYATPRKDSPLAPAVIRPLPFKFNVTRDKLTNVAMEVVDTKGYKPEDFGYVSFSIGVVNPLSIAVFTTGEGGTKLAEAHAFLYLGTELIGEYNLKAKVNLISFKGDPDASYKLMIRKPGYQQYITHFIYSELIEHLANLPLDVLLGPAFTIETAVVSQFEVELSGIGGVIDVDWGDGAIDSFDFSVDPVAMLNHTYSADGIYFISITGDVDQVTDFYNYYDAGGKATDIRFEQLSGLRQIRYGLISGPAVIDLSTNTQLDFINIAGIAELEELILPSTHDIDFIISAGPNLFTTPVIDAIINSIYTNAVEDNIHGGVFGLQANWADNESGYVGSPSAPARAQLDELRTTYGWNVTAE